MTKFYNDVTKQFYDTEEESNKAEAEELEARKKAEEEKQKLIEVRKARAEEIEEARKAMIEAQNNYEKLLREFLRDYKTYHYSTSKIEELPRLFSDLFFNF